MVVLRKLLLAVCCLGISVMLSQADTLSPRQLKSRRILLAGSAVIGSGASLAYLQDAWYSKYSSGSFHFFDDNAEWLQMDKAGHAYTCYQTGRLMIGAFKWAGYSRNKQLFIGGTFGLVYLTAIELMDGFSRGWGFSWGDLAADVAGCALVIGQEAAFKRQVVQLKFSYYPSGLAQYNPSLLGENSYTRILKDYNGQVYWLSFNPLWRKSDDKRAFPRWLCIRWDTGRME